MKMVNAKTVVLMMVLSISPVFLNAQNAAVYFTENWMHKPQPSRTKPLMWSCK